MERPEMEAKLHEVMEKALCSALDVCIDESTVGPSCPVLAYADRISDCERRLAGLADTTQLQTEQLAALADHTSVCERRLAGLADTTQLQTEQLAALGDRTNKALTRLADASQQGFDEQERLRARLADQINLALTTSKVGCALQKEEQTELTTALQLCHEASEECKSCSGLSARLNAAHERRFEMLCSESRASRQAIGEELGEQARRFEAFANSSEKVTANLEAELRRAEADLRRRHRAEEAHCEGLVEVISRRSEARCEDLVEALGRRSEALARGVAAAAWDGLEAAESRSAEDALRHDESFAQAQREGKALHERVAGVQSQVDFLSENLPAISAWHQASLRDVITHEEIIGDLRSVGEDLQALRGEIHVAGKESQLARAEASSALAQALQYHREAEEQRSQLRALVADHVKKVLSEHPEPSRFQQACQTQLDAQASHAQDLRSMLSSLQLDVNNLKLDATSAAAVHKFQQNIRQEALDAVAEAESRLGVALAKLRAELEERQQCTARQLAEDRHEAESARSTLRGALCTCRDELLRRFSEEEKAFQELVSKEKDDLDTHIVRLTGRLDGLERLVSDTLDQHAGVVRDVGSMRSVQGKLQNELKTSSLKSAAVDERFCLLERSLSELADRQGREIGALRARVEEDQHMASTEERLDWLDRTLAEVTQRHLQERQTLEKRVVNVEHVAEVSQEELSQLRASVAACVRNKPYGLGEVSDQRYCDVQRQLEEVRSAVFAKCKELDLFRNKLREALRLELQGALASSAPEPLAAARAHRRPQSARQASASERCASAKEARTPPPDSLSGEQVTLQRQHPGEVGTACGSGSSAVRALDNEGSALFPHW